MAFPSVQSTVIIDNNFSRYRYAGGPNFIVRNVVNGHLYTFSYQFPYTNRQAKFYRSSDGGLTWNSPLTFTGVNDEGDNRRLCMFMDRNQRIHFVHRGNWPGYQMTHRYSDDEFDTETVEYNMLTLVDLVQGCAGKNNDNRYTRMNGTFPSERYYQQWVDGAFGAPAQFTETLTPWDSEVQQIWNDIFDRKCALWTDDWSNPAPLYFIRSTVSEPTIPAELGTPVVAWPLTPGRIIQPYFVLSIDKFTNKMAAAFRTWDGGTNWYIRFIVSLDNGATWLDRGDLPGSHMITGDGIESAVRSVCYYHNNVIYVYMRVGTVSPKIVLIYSLDDGVTWSAPIDIVPNSTGYVTRHSWLGGLGNDPNHSYPGTRFPIIWNDISPGSGDAPVPLYFNPGVTEYGSVSVGKVMAVF